MQPAFYLAACLLLWGLASFAMKLTGTRLDPVTIVVCNTAGYLVMGVVLLPRANLAATPTHALAGSIGILFVLGNMAFYKLSQTTQLSVLAPITGLYILLPVVLGFAFLGEPVTARKCVGIVLALVAMYLLSAADEV